jgi:hypothetical protein
MSAHWMALGGHYSREVAQKQHCTKSQDMGQRGWTAFGLVQACHRRFYLLMSGIGGEFLCPNGCDCIAGYEPLMSLWCDVWDRSCADMGIVFVTPKVMQF